MNPNDFFMFLSFERSLMVRTHRNRSAKGEVVHGFVSSDAFGAMPDARFART
jgi:hypothetical protein